MANNSKFYDQVWAIMKDSEEDASKTWNDLAKSNSPDDHEVCFLLAVQLRKHGRKKEAYEASKVLSEYNPSAKSYNIYLASTYDLILTGDFSVDQLKQVFDCALSFYDENGFEVNLAATLLKCCNYLISKSICDRSTFDKIYNAVSDEDKNNNSFIISQYYKRLVADKEIEKVQEYYSKLPLELKENVAIKNVMKTVQKEPENDNDLSKIGNVELIRKITIISDQENAEKYSALVQSFSLVAGTVDMFSDSIIENLNKANHKSSTAILIVTDKIKKQQQFQNIYFFILGFCAHKFGRDNVKIFLEKSVAKVGKDASTELKPSLLNNFEVFYFDTDVDFLTLLGKLKLIRA